MPNPPYTHLPDGTPLPEHPMIEMVRRANTLQQWLDEQGYGRFPQPDINSPDVSDEGEEIDCWNCEDQGWTVTVGGIRQPCPDCKTGDLFFYHERPPGAA